MTLSPYTIDVGPCKPDGSRDILLQHYQQPCFSTTHRGVSHVCLVKWPVHPSVEAAAQTTDLEEYEAIRAQRTEQAYQALLQSESLNGSSFLSSSAHLLNDPTLARQRQPSELHDSATRQDNAEATPLMEDYLCVFHREELADQYGRYAFVQPHTICTAYRVKDTTPVQLVLHNVSPRDIATCAVAHCGGGVFIRGHRQSSKPGYAASLPLEHDGVQYKPATDLWWMGSPLSIKPVYVAAPMAASPLSAKDEAPTATVSSPIIVTDPGRSGSPLAAQLAPASPVGNAAADGRTAQGQFHFARSRSSSPTPHASPSVPAAAAARRQDDGSAESNVRSESHAYAFPSSQSTGAGAGAAAAAASRSRYASVAATVLTQLPLYRDQFGTPLPHSLAVVRTAADELGLARTTPQHALDCMLWQWWPHRVRLPRLAGSTAALTVVASPHPSLSRHVLFLYDSHHQQLRVLRTPDVNTGEGELELLFTFPCGDLPFVLPCLHAAAHPAPVAVCNYPHPNWLSVYDVVALLERPSADTVAMQMDLGAYQTRHPQRFGEVRLLGGAAPSRGCRSEESDRGPSDDVAVGATSDGFTDVDAKRSQREGIARVWAADGLGGVAHPIRSLLYHYQARLILQYDWPSGTPQPPSTDAGQRLAEGDKHSSNGKGAADDAHRSRRSRRCEGTISYTVDLLPLRAEEHPLLALVLESLTAAVGPRAVATLEYALLIDAWQRRCKTDEKETADPLQTCAALLRELCATTLSSPQHLDQALQSSAPADSCGGAAERSAPLFDPCRLTLHAVRQALVQGQKPSSAAHLGASSERNNHIRGGTAALPAWTPQQSGLALVALHLLFEACRLQESLWPLLPPLAELNRALSAQRRWPSYMAFYDAMTAYRPRSSTSTSEAARQRSSFSDQLPQAVLVKHFDSLSGLAHQSPSSAAAHADAVLAADFAAGVAPDLFQALSLPISSSSSSSDSASAPLLYGSWPLLRHLPSSHPISLANTVVRLYHSFLGRRTAGADATGNTVIMPLAGLSHAGNKPVFSHASVDSRWWERVCSQLLQQRVSPRFVRELLNTGVAYPLLESIAQGREHATAAWPAVWLDLVGRRDRCVPTSLTSQLVSVGQHVVETAETSAVARQFCAALAEDDGVSVRPDFRATWRDARLDVVQNLFNTVTPISLAGYEDAPEELTKALELLSTRARAMPLGRGMLTMCTQSFKVQDSIPIPPLNLDGRTNDGIRIVNRSTEDLMWPLFHNGCAAGLRFLPLPPSFSAAGGDGMETADAVGASDLQPNVERLSVRDGASGADGAGGTAASEGTQTITKQWVMYQTKNIGNAASRAGLLLATGILGHLTVLQRTDIFYLLISRQEQYVWREATTMAVMLGLSCSFCGTSNEAVFRCLSVHVQSLNPSAEDIEVSLDVQTAALVSMGLLCQQAPSNAFLVEVLLVEISRLPTDEHCSKREGYVLGAGFGLGQLLLGMGASHGVPHVEDRLLAFMTGAPRNSAASTREGVEFFEETMGRGEAGHFLARALLSQEQREASFSLCASVYEGDCYNVFVSGPAAAMALGMMYMQTDSSIMAGKMRPPNRHTALQKLTPLLCHLRSTMASLIRWSAVEPSSAWLRQQLPTCLLELMTPAASGASVPGLAVQQRNYLLMNLAHCVAGHVMALGIRFAGTMNTEARDAIFGELQGFLSGRIGSTEAAIPAVQRVTGAYETCLLTCAVALSLVMAGTGDLKVFAALQHLHRRTTASYGSHMAVSMSMGILFLGSGRLTLSNHVTSAAALLMAFYPVWPSSAEDNTHHLQALRHLYGLAVVPRVMEATDAVSHQPVSVPVRIVLRKNRRCDVGFEATASDAAPAAAAAAVAVPHSSSEASVSEASSPPSAVADDGEPRAICTRTPCLYPPVELIERVEVHSPQHYPLVFHSFSKELTQSAGMVFRVMSKEGTSTVGSVGRASRTNLESRLMDWLHRLFHQRSTTAVAALTIIDSVKLMLQIHRRLVSTALAGELLLSGAFSAALQAAMEKRYGQLYLHRSGAGRALPSVTPPFHPLHQLIVLEQSPASVVGCMAAHPHGTDAFPCDLTQLMAAAQAAPLGGSSAVVRVPTVGAESGDAAFDVNMTHRWLMESLHFFGLKQPEQATIRSAFAALGVSAASTTAKHDATPPAVARLVAFLRLQAATQLPLSTLEKVWDCCT